MKMGKNLGSISSTDKNKVLAFIEARVKGHNSRFSGVAGKKATVEMYKEVFSRGYFRQKNYGIEKESDRCYWAFRRLRDFQYILKNGYPRPQSDITIGEDFDLLPKGHRLHSKFRTYHYVRYDFWTDKTYIDEYRNELVQYDTEYISEEGE